MPAAQPGQRRGGCLAQRAVGGFHIPGGRYLSGGRHLPGGSGCPGAQRLALGGQPIPSTQRAGPVRKHGKHQERCRRGHPQPGVGPAIYGGEGGRTDDPRAGVEQQPRRGRQPRPGDPGPPPLGPHRPLERVPPAADVAGTAFGEGLERRPAATGHDPGTGQDQPLGPGQAAPRRRGRGHATPQLPRRPFGDREIAAGGEIEDRGRVRGTIQPAAGHAHVHKRRPHRRQARPGIRCARPQGRLVSTEHQPNTTSHAAAAAIASTSTVRVPLSPGGSVLHRSGGTATAVRLLSTQPWLTTGK